MARATFSNIKRDDPELFVVQVKGHLGVKERPTVEHLLQRCEEKNKTKVIFEFSGLESLGGGVAKLLGRFVAQREGRGLAPVFVGCSQTVETFLQARCEGAAPVFCKSLGQAEAHLEEQAAQPGPPPAPEPAEAAPESVEETPEPTAEAEPEKPRGAQPPRPTRLAKDQPQEAPAEPASGPGPESSRLRILEVDKPAPAARYLSLAEAEKAFAAARDLAGMRGALGALLYGVDLADVCHLLTRRDGYLVEVGEDGHRLPLHGAVAGRLLGAHTPIAIEDLTSVELDEAEAELLTAWNCQMAVPVVVDGCLEGALFLRKERAGSEYGPSEVLALDLLGRKLAHALRQGGEELSAEPAAPAEGDTSRELSRKVHQQRALFKIGKEFSSTLDEDHLVNLVLLTVIAQVGVGSVAWFEFDGQRLEPRKHRGQDELELDPVDVVDPEAVRQLQETLRLDDPDTAADLEGAWQKLSQLGFLQVAPLRGKTDLFGVLALGPRLAGGKGEIDHEFLSILLNQAGNALENARLIRHLHDRTLSVAQTFVNLIEKRSGPGARASTELISHYVAEVARKISYPPDQIRDLVYGTVLRDIGMIEISDLVLRSPRSLTPEEWRLIKQHPLTGVEILSSMDFSSTITDVVLYHHERFNGEGYPHGLRGAAIPLGARIVSVVESFVAMTRDLPYRAALSRAEALEVIRENWGMRYDPEVLVAFLEIVEAEGEEEPEVSGHLVGAR